MSQKKSKEARQKEKILEEAQKEGEKILFTINVNIHKNGQITVGPLPVDPNVTVDILTKATRIGTQFCIQKMMEGQPMVQVVPGMPNMPLPPGGLHS